MIEKDQEDGMSAYDILREFPDCPIKLPTARSMTQARIDYQTLSPAIFEWYKNNKIEVNKMLTRLSNL